MSVHVMVVFLEVHLCARERRRSELEYWLQRVRIGQLDVVKHINKMQRVVHVTYRNL